MNILCDWFLFLQALKWIKYEDPKVNSWVRFMDQFGIRVVPLLGTNGSCLKTKKECFVWKFQYYAYFRVKRTWADGLDSWFESMKGWGKFSFFQFSNFL